MRKSGQGFLQAGLVAILLATGTQAWAQGLYGEYHEYDPNPGASPLPPTFLNPVAERLDAMVNFIWGNTVPNAPDVLPAPLDINPDSFCVRWSGLLQTTTGGVYTFQTRSDDGSRLWVNGTLVIDRWQDQPLATWQGTINLLPNTLYDIRFEYFENPVDAEVHLEWQPPGAPGIVPIPTSQLIPRVDTPAIIPNGGAFSNAVQVSIACDTAGAVIRYTLDGSTPTAASPIYMGPFIVNSNLTVRAIAFRDAIPGGIAMIPSAVATAVFTVVDLNPPQIVTAIAVTPTQVLVVFDEPLALGPATTNTNYQIDGVNVASAALSVDLRTVVLVPAAALAVGIHTLNVSNITDLAAPPNMIPANTQKVFNVVAPDPCLVNHWPFNETGGAAANDVVGTNPGTLTNGPLRVDGQVGNGLSFDGVNQFVDLANNLAPLLGNTASLTFWMRTTGFGNSTMFRSPGVTGSESVGDGNDVFWGWINQNGQIGVQAGDVAGAQSPAPVNNDQWHHIALTRDAATGDVAIYVDAGPATTAISDVGFKSTPFDALGRIFGAFGTSNQPLFYLGQLDEIKTFNCILTAGEVERDMNLSPSVNAGPDQRIPATFPNAMTTLNGTVTDDNLPVVGGPLTTLWTLVSGPAGVLFSAPGSLATNVTFTAPGAYVIRLTANDGHRVSSDDVIVRVDRVSVTPIALTTSEPNLSVIVTVTINGTASTAPVMITMTGIDTTEGSVGPNPLVLPTGVSSGTFTVTGVDDTLVDGPIGYIIVTTVTSGDPSLNGTDAADVQVTNLDNDVPGITVTPLSVIVSENLTTATFTINLDTIPTSNVTIIFNPTDAGEATVAPPGVTFIGNSATAVVPVTITVTGVDDPILDFTQVSVIQVLPAVSFDPVYNGMDGADVQVFTLDNEAVPPVDEVWGGCFSVAGARLRAPWLWAAFVLLLFAFSPRRRESPVI